MKNIYRIQSEQNELVETDAKFWQDAFSKRAKSFTEEHDINAFSEHGFLRRGVTFERVLNLLPKGGRALDIGCGSGVYSFILQKRGFEVCAVDISPEMINVARKRLLGNPANFSAGNAYHLHFRNETFDMIICNEIFQYLANPQGALSEMTRVLKKGGILLLTTLNSSSFFWFLTRLKEWKLNSKPYWREFLELTTPLSFKENWR